jgi:hypothetical protein
MRFRDEITRPTGSRLADVAAAIAIGMALLEATTRGGLFRRLMLNPQKADGERGVGHHPSPDWAIFPCRLLLPDM